MDRPASQLRLVSVSRGKRKRGGVRLGVIGVSAVVMIAVSIYVAQASHNFSDVPTEAFYHSAVEWIVTRGITAGCAVGLYCPDAAVTRGTMAVFLQRLGQYIENLLSSPGMINVTTNPVDWTKLKGVPSGIADGLDNDSGGDITQVTAGAGLTGGALSGAATLNANFRSAGSANTLPLSIDVGGSEYVARADHIHDARYIRSKKMNYRSAAYPGTGGGLVLNNFAGLTLNVSCTSGDLQALASTSVNNTAIWIFGHLNEIAVTDFDTTDAPFDILGESDNTAGTIIYSRPDSVDVFVIFMAEEDPYGPDAPDAKDCVFVGVAFVGQHSPIATFP